MTKIANLMAKVSKLDTYTQLSILGSWSFTANAQCISQASKYVPEAPINTGIEELTQYEAARRKLLTEAETSYLPPFLALQRELNGMVNEADGQARGIEDTLTFLTERGPNRAQFVREYDERVRLGMKPGISRKAFADAEYERANKAHNDLVAKGEDAVRLCETVTIAEHRGYNDLPEWVAETFERKMVEKAHARWEKLEMARTNPRYPKVTRDGAAADQMLIVNLLAQYGEVPGSEEDLEAANQANIDAQQSLIDMPNDDLDDPRKPGPVIITKFQRAPAPTDAS